MRFEYEDRDYVVDIMCEHHRSDLVRYAPLGGESIGTNERLFWIDTIARFRRGEVWDAITAIERRFKPQGRFTAYPVDNNAYHFVEPAN